MNSYLAQSSYRVYVKKSYNEKSTELFIYYIIYGSHNMLGDLTWVGMILFFPERQQGMKFTNILLAHVKTHDILWLP